MEKYNLFQEVSYLLNMLLEEYKIEHTKADISFLRRKVLEIIAKERINQKNYDIHKHQVMLNGTIYHEIDNLYGTKLTDSIAESLKPYDYRGLSP